ncbi:MAG: hypothetical protein RIQ52_1360 [Pseudomonadota bacterium]|jgi:uncharacterized protein (DUF2164 family)
MKAQRILPILLAASLTACAGAKVKKADYVSDTHMSKPDQVLIYNFAASTNDIKQNSGPIASLIRHVGSSDENTEKQAMAKEVADALAAELTTKLKKWGFNAIRVDQSMPTKTGDLLISGTFTNIDEGNQARRTMIGLGAGQSSVDARVLVQTPTAAGNRELMGFTAHADSGKMPGAAVMGPAGIAAGAGAATTAGVNVAKGAAQKYSSETSTEAEHMADAIVEELGKYFVKQGWISQDTIK